jgi:NhaP-type Na+/H+ and K+/H+ antiporter
VSTTLAAYLVVFGALLGFLGGGSARQLLSAGRSRSANALFVVMSLAVLFLLVGGTQLLGGSGLLAAYIAGLVLGNGPETDRVALVEAHQGFAKLAELLLFLCLGLVVQADQVVDSLPWALVLFLIMQLARWLMVETLLLRNGFGQPEKLMITAAGIRGAVPIALAIQAAASGVRWGMEMPPLALAVVLLGLLLQGFSLVPLARRLGLASTG